MDQGLARSARDRGEWIILNCARVLYAARGRETVLCDRLPSPITLVVKLRREAAMTIREDEMVGRAKSIIVDAQDVDVATGIGRFDAAERDTILRALEAITALSSEREVLVRLLVDVRNELYLNYPDKTSHIIAKIDAALDTGVVG